MNPVGGEVRGTPTITLETHSGGVIPVAVDLDGNALLAPEEVDLVAGDQHIGLGNGKARLSNQRKESLLRLRSRKGRTALGLENATNRGRTCPPSVSRGQERHLLPVDELLTLGPCQRALQLAPGDHGREIDQGPRRHRDGDPVENGPLIEVQPPAGRTRIPGLRALRPAGTVTSTGAASSDRVSPHSEAALRWLRTAAAPQASTAAISRVRGSEIGPTR